MYALTDLGRKELSSECTGNITLLDVLYYVLLQFTCTGILFLGIVTYAH